MHKRDVSKKVVVGMLAGTVLAVGCGPTTGSEESALKPSRQALLAVNAPVAAGTQHALAISSGTVRAWGRDNHGQLGNGATTDGNWSTTPVTVSGLSNVVSIGAGDAHGLAIKSDGTLWAWGLNDSGQLGDGNPPYSKNSPVQVTGLPSTTVAKVVAVSGGLGHTLALLDNGTIWSWGSNSHGQLGRTGTTSTAGQVTLPAGYTAEGIAAGTFHSLALLRNNTTLVTYIYAWGRNDQSQLADGTTTNRTAPVQVTGLPTNAGVPVDVEAGIEYSLAVFEDSNGTRTVWGWGDNLYGQLGNGTRTDSSSAVQVSSLTGATVVSAGRWQTAHSMALVSGGVWAWGADAYGEIGDNRSASCANGGYQTTPYQTSLSSADYVAAGGEFSVAHLSDGTVWTWGLNTYGRLGLGSTADCFKTPQQVTGL
jgi:alpha-tubulin suppressor-like RCC1 family protein